MNRCSIILVHGTWGRGFFPKLRFPPNKRYWFEEGSQFHARLDGALKNASLDWPVRAFLWSGANSVHARDSAASELSDELRKDLEDPDATAVIIAHSHGGNVALRALQYLDSMANRIRVVTLATPFLRVFPRESWEPPLLVTYALWALFFSFLIPKVVLGSFSILSWASPTSIADYVPFSLSWVTLLLLGGVLTAAVASIFIVRWLVAIFANPDTARAIAQQALYDTKGAAAAHMLIIRGVDDEASLSLAAGSIGSRLSSLILVGMIPAAFLLGAFLSLPFSLIRGVFPRTAKMAETLTFISANVAAFGALTFLILPGVFKSVFGREFLIRGLVCDIAADSVPDTVDRVEAITLAPEAPSMLQGLLQLLMLQMRHGIYNHPACVGEIVRWLRRVT